MRTLSINQWIGCLALVLVCANAKANITDVIIESVKPFADGKPFGEAGAYERVKGKAKGVLNPDHERNRGIVNLGKAPKNDLGLIPYEVEFDVLRPVNGGNRKILYDVTNRGRKFVLNWVLDGAGENANDPMTEADAGNALFLRQGWTIVWSGWDPDAPRAKGGLSMTAPLAKDGLKQQITIVRPVRDEFVSGTRGAPVKEFKLSYETASLIKPDSRLTVRRKQSDSRAEIPVTQWEFVDRRTIRLLNADGSPAIPEPGSLYELTYPARDPKVLGFGFAATRDLMSLMRHQQLVIGQMPNPAGPGIKSVLAIGISQSGRFLRDFIHQGFNQDENGKKVFDGVLSHIAGAGGVYLNAEFGQPARTNTQHEDHDYPEAAFPFSSASLTDPVSEKTGALLRGDGFDPLLIEINTSTEYWQKGASLLHTDPVGQKDAALPPNARVYLVAGTQHTGKAGLTTAKGPCANERNPHSPAPLLRALTVALDQWVSEGVPPPASRIPTLRDKTLVAADSLRFPAIPNWVVAKAPNAIGAPVNLLGNASPEKRYRPLVAKVDADGNEVAGVRLPDIAVPLATYTGWNLYQEPYPSGELCDRDGSYRAFPMTRANRLTSKDPRRAIQERYKNQADYVGKVKRAADALVKDRLLLDEDAAAYVERASSPEMQKWFSK